MGSEWEVHPLEDCMDAIIDYRGKTPKKTSFGVPLITAKIIKNGIILPVAEYIAEKDYEFWMSRGIPKPGDIVITTEAPLGEVAQLDYRKIALAQRVITLRGKKDFLDNRFLKYLILSEYVQHQLDVRGTGTTVKGIKQSELRKIKLKFPPYSEQKAIAHILGTLDDKIELNRQMNSTLESMAQAMFKSWFVDFDPVIDNALAAGNPIPESLKARAENRRRLGDQRKTLTQEIQQQFPSRFVLSEELGWIPEGWGIGCFGDFAQHIRANVKAENVGDADFYIGLEHIGKKLLFLTGSGAGKSVESNKSGFQKRDLLFGKLRPYFHKVCLAPCEGICSTDILVFRAKQAFSQSYMTLTAFSEEFVDYANMRSTGTRMPRASAKDMLGYVVTMPNKEILIYFEEKIKPIWEKGMYSAENSTHLTNFRDTLLPKLISGQLRLPDSLIEKFAEQANSHDAEQIISEAI